MLHRKPQGKYHVQICTNISCLLVGGEELWDHACHKLGIGHKQVTPRTAHFARRSGMHRRLLLGAGRSGELRFSITMSRRTRSNKLIDELAGKSGRDRRTAEGQSMMLYNQPNPLEVRILSRRFGLPNSHRSKPISNRRLQGARKSAGHDAGRDHQRSQSFGSARTRRRGLSDRHEVELRAAPVAQAEVHHGQRGRERAGHLQGPPADRVRSAPDDRRHPDRGSGGRARSRVTSTFAANIAI
jgi:hypothetical protein